MEFTVREAKKQLQKFEEKPERRLGFAPEWPQFSDEALFGPLPPKELAAWEPGDLRLWNGEGE